MSDALTVIKCGGGPGLDPVLVCPDVAALRRDGRVLLVHGGSAEVERLAARLDVPQRRLTTPSGTSSRYTDPATLEVLTLALAGAVKPRLLAELHRLGVPAIGLTGIDAGVLRARRSPAHRARVDGRLMLIRDDHTGRLDSVAAEPLRMLLAAGLTPVLSPPAVAQDGTVVNVDADRAAALVAAALGATSLIYLTAAPGLLRDPADETSLVAHVDLTAGVDAAVRGGMAVKMLAARIALDAGVPRVVVADGRPIHPVRRALDGAGTRLTAGPRAVPVGTRS